MFVGFVVTFALFALPILAVVAAVVVGVGWRIGLVRKQWSFISLATLSIILPPAVWLQINRVEAANCRAAHGFNDLSCGGELGGVFILLFQFALILGGLIIGPVLGNHLYRRWEARAE